MRRNRGHINRKKNGKSALFILASFGLLMYVRNRLIPRYPMTIPFLSFGMESITVISHSEISVTSV